MKLRQIFFIVIALLFPSVSALAQTLENIPGQDPVGSSDLTGYLNSLYKFGISISGILAIFMIGLGAFAYMVTSVGNSSKMSDAKEKIQNALIGLVIVLTAYLFLYVINPDLVGGTLSAPSTAVDDIINPPNLPSEIGCCINVIGDCTASVTRASCEGSGELFTGGDNLVCQAVGLASSCVVGAPSGPPVSATDMGCCVYSGSTTFLNACEPLTDRLNCEGTLNGAFTSGTGLSCVLNASGYSCQ